MNQILATSLSDYPFVQLEILVSPTILEWLFVEVLGVITVFFVFFRLFRQKLKVFSLIFSVGISIVGIALLVVPAIIECVADPAGVSVAPWILLAIWGVLIWLGGPLFSFGVAASLAGFVRGDRKFLYLFSLVANLAFLFLFLPVIGYLTGR